MITRIAVAAVSVLLAFGLTIAAQEAAAVEPVDGALFEQGQQIYEALCASCHRADGSGLPPTFPAHRGNERLQDLDLIVQNVRHGKGAMPAFPNLDVAEIAAVATYIRNAWGNEFGGVTARHVAELLDEDAEDDADASVWDGVFTEEQAERGRQAFVGHCAECHGTRGDGVAVEADAPPSPAIARSALFDKWGGQSLAVPFEIARGTMPLINPGGLDDQMYADIMAHILALSGLPAGDEELAADPDRLGRIAIEREPED